MWIFILLVYSLNVVCANPHHNDSQLKHIKRGASEITSFSYASTDIGSKDGTHIKTVTLVKNYGKDVPKAENINPKDFKDIAEIVKLFSDKSHHNHHHHHHHDGNEDEMKKDDEENKNNNNSADSESNDESKVEVENENNDEKKEETDNNSNKETNDEPIMEQEDVEVIDTGNNNSNNEQENQGLMKTNKKLQLSKYSNSNNNHDIVPSYLLPLSNGKLIFYGPPTPKRSVNIHQQNNKYKDNTQKKHTNILYLPKNLPVTTLNQNKFNIPSSHKYQQQSLNVTKLSIPNTTTTTERSILPNKRKKLQYLTEEIEIPSTTSTNSQKTFYVAPEIYNHFRNFQSNENTLGRLGLSSNSTKLRLTNYPF